MNDDHKNDFIKLTSEIVAAYVTNNHVQATELPVLIGTINQALSALAEAPAPVEAEPPKPAVAIKKSVTDDYLISLFDGRKFKSLKRHLMTVHNMSPDEYRAMFKLPKDYPMVAPGYAKHRSTLAKSLGLGRKPAATEPEAGIKPNRAKAAA